MRKHLFSCSHDTTFVELYVVSGPLPTLIEHTYQHYLALLNTLRSAAFEYDSSVWKGSYIEKMIAHHSSELGQIRETASDYRMHLLETYIYLRNARRDKFQDPSFMRSLLDRMGRSEAPPPDAPRGGEDSSGGPNPPPTRCSHCRRNGLHPGTGKSDCTLQLLPRGKAQSAVQGLNRIQAKNVATGIASALRSDPATPHDALIARIRGEVT
jgi:hypothetical protein